MNRFVIHENNFLLLMLIVLFINTGNFIIYATNTEDSIPNAFQIIDTIEYPSTNINVVISDIKWNNQPLNISNHPPLEQSIDEVSEIVLNYKSNSIITLMFSTMGNIQNPVYYSVQLEGLSNDWISIGTNNIITFTNLAPYNYLLRVKAKTKKSKWNTRVSSLRIVILPPWWESWWFISLIVIFILLCIFLIFKRRLNTLKNQSGELARLVEKRTNEIVEKNVELIKQKTEIANQAEILKASNINLEIETEKVTKTYDQLKTLSNFGQKITSKLNIQAINNIIYEYISSMMETSALGVGIYNENLNQIEYISFFEDGIPTPYFIFRMDETDSLSVWCLKNKKEILINNTLQQYSTYLYKEPAYKTRQLPQSYLYVPLHAEDRTIGVITVQCFRENAYDHQDLTNLRTLASYVTVALDNANAYKIIHLKNKELQMTNDELMAIEEELRQNTEALSNANNALTNANSELQEYRDHLEALIKERTGDLIVAKEKAVEADKLKSAFLANISHEIRTPMNAIIGFTNLLDDNNLSSEERYEYINLINSNTNSLLNMIDDILNISRIEAGEMKISKMYCDIMVTMKELLGFFNKSMFDKGKEDVSLLLENNIQNRTISTITDQNLLRQVFSNLISNAIKYTEEGEIVFGVNKIFKDKTGTEILEFYVKDTGIGIAEEKIPVIFDLFRKEDSSKAKLFRGVGLGLAISKRLIKYLGGDITVQSVVNKGSTFYFTIPYIKSEALPHVESNLIEEKHNLQLNDWSNKTIVVAEDEDSNYQFIKSVLRNTKVNILRAYTGLEVVEQCRAKKEIDLVLMDIKMPEISGYEATRQIKKIRRELPIIAQTAFAAPQEREKSIEAGCDDYIAKPFTAKALIELVKTYLNI